MRVRVRVRVVRLHGEHPQERREDAHESGDDARTAAIVQVGDDTWLELGLGLGFGFGFGFGFGLPTMTPPGIMPTE